MKIFHLAFKCIWLYGHILGVRGLRSSVDIMGCINENMLVIEVNVEFSIMNGFMNKYMHRQQAIKM